MPNPNLSQASLNNNLILQGLSLPSKARFVIAQDYGYNKLQQFTEWINRKSGGAKRVWQRRFDTYGVGNLNIAQTVASSVVSGTDLIVTWTAANDNFREGFVIADSNYVKGRITQVISNLQVRLTIAQDGLAAWSAASHFTAGMTAKNFFDASSSRSSRGKPSLYVTPNGSYNYISTSRDSITLEIDDFISTFVETQDGYWYTAQQMFCLQQESRAEELKLYWSDRFMDTSISGNPTYMTGGLRWSVINNGGNYFPISGILSQNDWEDILNSMATVTPNRSRHIVAFMGQQAMSNIQRLTQNIVTYSGSNNTFGGAAVKGWDVKRYSGAGVDVEYVHCPMFDDTTLFPEISTATGQPKMSSTIFMVDMTPVQTYGGPARQVIEKKYFGAEEYRMRYTPGMTDLTEANGGSPEKFNVEAGAGLAVSDLPGMTFNIMEESGYDIIADSMGLIELTS